MEIHKDLKIDSKFKILAKDNDIISYFTKALDFTKTYYNDDFERISGTKFNDITVQDFFKEYVWCVYTSGFNAKIVSKFFNKLMIVYDPLLKEVILNNNPNINSIDVGINALGICNNNRKVKSVIKTAFSLGEKIKEQGWEKFKSNNLNSPDKLKLLPFVGPITCFHLARNIGLLDYVKPDLHLVRLANYYKFNNCEEMCKFIQLKFDLPLGIIDLVLWYTASTFGTNNV